MSFRDPASHTGIQHATGVRDLEEIEMTTMQLTNVTRAAADRTKALLACGVAAPIVFGLVALSQAATRPGFDMTVHPVSMLSNGSLGWIQIASFLITGSLMIACAVGVRRVLRGGPGGKWAPRLLGVFGAGYIGAAVFVMDPGMGFPVGATTGYPVFTWHGILHNAFATPAFLCLIAACFVFGSRFASEGQRGWAACSRVAGLVFIAGLGWAFTGGAGGSLTLFAGCLTAWGFVAAAAARFAFRPAPVA